MVMSALPAPALRRRALVALAVALLPAAARAQPAPPQPAGPADGAVSAVGDGADLLLRDAAGRTLRRYPVRSLDGRERGRVRQAVALPARRSLLVTFDGLREWWEVSLDPAAEPIFDGLVHDHRMGEAIATAGYLGARRTRLPEPLQVVSVDAGGFVLARGADLPDGRHVLHVVQLDLRKALARFVVDS